MTPINVWTLLNADQPAVQSAAERSIAKTRGARGVWRRAVALARIMRSLGENLHLAPSETPSQRAMAKLTSTEQPPF